MFDDYYEILGIRQSASQEEIKRAYHEKARKFHPDVNPSDAANETFLAVQEAFEILKDKDKRAAYDKKLESEEFSVPLVRYKVIGSRQQIQRINEDQLIYALLEIECLKQPEEIHEPQSHVCLVVDQSTSMKGKRIDMVKANISRLLKELSGRDLISIVTFSDDAQIILPPTSITNINLIDSKISQITPAGGTEIKKGLQTGIDLLWKGKEKNSASYLVLLTDGQTYGDEDACLALAKKAAKRGIVINSLGIGNDWNDHFLEKLTSITGGTASLVSSKDDLVTHLQRIFESLDIVYARNLTLYSEPDPRYEMKSLFRLEPGIVEFSNLDQQIVLGDLLYKKRSIYLMEFLVHPLIIKDKNVELLSGPMKMELPEENGMRARLFPGFSLPVTDEKVKEKPPVEIIKALSVLNFYMMQERSRSDVNIGNFVNATRRLNFLATRLISAGELQLASRVLSESESIQKDHHFTLNGEKELKYGTKRLLGMSNS
jgi:Ca-activated chloride channel family protein